MSSGIQFSEAMGNLSQYEIPLRCDTEKSYWRRFYLTECEEHAN